MTYQVLARKWRPRAFDQLVGQPHVVTALVNALDIEAPAPRLPLHRHPRRGQDHARAHPRQVDQLRDRASRSQPCGKCRACTDIDAGRFVDLLEVDAATNTKVDEMRELLDTAQYMPVSGRFKVYIIDEVHMLSRHAFNSMLKTLEEPPEHVKFILATTDPQRLPVTVLSRCLQFNLKPLRAAMIAGHLKHVLEAEKHRVRGARARAARHGRGGQRARQPEPARPGDRLRFRQGHGRAGRRHARRARRRPRLARCSSASPRATASGALARGRAASPSAAFPSTRRCRTSPRSCIASRSRRPARARADDPDARACAALAAAARRGPRAGHVPDRAARAARPPARARRVRRIHDGRAAHAVAFAGAPGGAARTARAGRAARRRAARASAGRRRPPRREPAPAAAAPLAPCRSTATGRRSSSA